MAPSVKTCSYAAFAVLVALLFVWPIPHTISLRETLFFIALSGYIYLSIASKNLHQLKSPALKPMRVPLYLHAGLTAWILIGIFFISDHPMAALREFKSEWLMGILSAVLGALVALHARDRASLKTIIIAVFGVLMLHVSILDGYAFYKLLDTGIFPAGESFRIKALIAPDRMNYASIFALVMLLSESIHRATNNRRFLPLTPLHLTASYGLVLLSIYIEGFRFGTISAALLIATAAITLFSLKGVDRNKVLPVAALVLMALIGLSYASISSDERWKTLSETIALATDPEVSERWLYDEKFRRPRLEDRRRAENSNFYRALYLKQGLALVAEYPLGVGFSRDAFPWAIMKRYGVEKTGHTHSGLLDLTLGVGVPGAILWCGLLVSIISAALSRMKVIGSYPAAFMFLFTIAFTIRMLTDSIIRDDMLQWFAFVAAFLGVSTLVDVENAGEE
jgi:hypothetical protein